MRKLFISLIVLCSVAHGTITLNHTSLPTSSSGANNAFTVTSTTGNAIIIAIGTDNGTDPTSCTDNKSNAYTLTSVETSSQGDVSFCYSFSTTSAVTTVTIHKAAGGCEVAVYDLSSSTGGAFDVSAFAQSATGGTGSSANPSTSLTAAGAGFIAAVVMDGQNPSAVSSGFTLDTFDSANIAHFGAAAHDVNGSGGSITCTFTVVSSPWSVGMLSVKEGSAVAVKHNMTLLGVGP